MEEQNIAMETENIEVEETQTVTPLDDVIGNYDPSEVLNHPALKKALQSSIDSRVTQALSTARTKWENEAKENMDEAKKLEKMTKEQRESYELAKEKEQFELEKKKFEHEQLINSAGRELMKRGLDSSFAEYLTADTADNTIERIGAFEKAFNDAVSSALNNRMKGNVPKEKETPKGFSKEEIKKMTPQEINRNWDAVKEALKG